MTETGINTAGEALDWVAALAYGGRGARPRAGDYERLDREAAGVPPGADGLLFVPVLGDGERDDPALRGTVTGLSLRHGRAAWARAAMEGVAFGMRALLEVLGRDRERAAELRVSGQAAGLGTWNQIKADVLGVPVRRVPGDATAAGVAMLAGIGPASTPARARRSPPPATRRNRCCPAPAVPGGMTPSISGTGPCWPPTWPASVRRRGQDDLVPSHRPSIWPGPCASMLPAVPL